MIRKRECDAVPGDWTLILGAPGGTRTPDHLVRSHTGRIETLIRNSHLRRLPLSQTLRNSLILCLAKRHFGTILAHVDIEQHIRLVGMPAVSIENSDPFL